MGVLTETEIVLFYRLTPPERLLCVHVDVEWIYRRWSDDAIPRSHRSSPLVGHTGDSTLHMTTPGHATMGLTSVAPDDTQMSTFVVTAIEVELLGRGCNSLTDAPL